jgi:hypothetical protein
MWHVQGKGEMYMEVWWLNLKERGYLKYRGIGGEGYS